MLKVENVVKAIEAFAPLDIQAEYDNSGLLFGDPQWEIKGILVTLDNSEEAVKEAIEKGCNMIVEHHPSIFLPVKKINLSVPKQRALALAIKNDIAIYSAHTTVDFTVGGLNDKVAEMLGLENIVNADNSPSGARIGRLKSPMALDAFAKRVAEVFDDKHSFYVGDKDAVVRTVAVINGAGGGSESVIFELKNAGTDVLITSEYKYNVIRLAKDLGYAIISVGHYDSEAPFCNLIKDVLHKDDIGCVFVAETGTNPVN